MNKLIYRIEHPEDKDGMWYTKEGIARKRIQILCPDGIAKDFPMPFDFERNTDGNIWCSAGKSIENMNQWFTAQDAMSLYNNGFKLFQFEVSKFKELEMEILFCRDYIVKQKEIPLETVWNLETK